MKTITVISLAIQRTYASLLFAFFGIVMTASAAGHKQTPPVSKAELIKLTKKDCYDYGVDYLKVDMGRNGCVRVFVRSNGKERSGLATTLCSQVGKLGGKCVEIVNKNGGVMGSCFCR